MSFAEWINNTFYNDLSDIPLYIWGFVYFMIILWLSVAFHELGHALYFKRVLKKKVKIRFRYINLFRMYWECGEEKDYCDLKPHQYHDLLMIGIATGILPILVASFLWFPTILMIIPYSFGVYSDVKEMAKVYDELEKCTKEVVKAG